jgi:hypothetical protein
MFLLTTGITNNGSDRDRWRESEVAEAKCDSITMLNITTKFDNNAQHNYKIR